MNDTQIIVMTEVDILKKNIADLELQLKYAHEHIRFLEEKLLILNNNKK